MTNVIKNDKPVNDVSDSSKMFLKFIFEKNIDVRIEKWIISLWFCHRTYCSAPNVTSRCTANGYPFFSRAQPKFKEPCRTGSVGVEVFHRQLLKAATYHQYIVPNMCSNPSICPSSFPKAYGWTLFKWLILFSRSTYSSTGHHCTLERMLQTLFTS